MTFRKLSLILSACAAMLMCNTPLRAQDGPDDEGGGGGGGRASGKPRPTVEMRIKRQRGRIARGLEKGTLSADQAKKLRAALDQLESVINSQKQTNGGQLKKEQLVQAENSLNQSNQQIKSLEGAGTKPVDNSNVLGPTWSPGKDGGQNPGTLLKKMKDENKREQRQYKQQMEQTLEQQQLDYEKQTMQTLSDQKKNIQKQQGDLKKVRKATGTD